MYNLPCVYQQEVKSLCILRWAFLACLLHAWTRDYAGFYSYQEVVDDNEENYMNSEEMSITGVVIFLRIYSFSIQSACIASDTEYKYQPGCEQYWCIASRTIPFTGTWTCFCLSSFLLACSQYWCILPMHFNLSHRV